MNPRKNRMCKNVWIDEKELKELINAIEGNYQDQVFDLIFKIHRRGDFCV